MIFFSYLCARFCTVNSYNDYFYTMKKAFIFCTALAASLAVMAQKETLMTINGKPVSAEEFLYIYEKNNQEGAVDPKTMDEYLDMFINFKLKVAEAEAQGIDTTAAFKKN